MKRLLTKQDREDSRKYQFEYLQNNGYQKIEHKNLIIFSNPEKLTIKSFWGSAANHTDYIQFNSIERLQAKINSLISTADSREEWKAKQKEKNKGYKSNQAAAAAAIKAELKTKYPNVKFSVTSESFAGGDSVCITWINGPTSGEVDKITKKYQYGSFNGMEDIYEYTNDRSDIPQSKYVQTSRTLSEQIKELVKCQLLETVNFTPEQLTDYRNNPEGIAYRILYKTHIPEDYKSVKIVSDTDQESSELYKIAFETEQPEPTAQETQQPIDNNKIQIVYYSEKAFAVIGNFSDHYTNLINLGGAYNSRLKCGRGIIFSKKKLEAVKAYFLEATQKNGEQQPEEPKAEETAPPTLHTQPNFETPSTNIFMIEYFKILWHEGFQEPNYTNAIFTTWEEVQTAFLNLWESNEKGQDGGYTKVKCEMKFKDQEVIIDRIDITNKINNGDFNPSQIHILSYLQSIADETEPEPEPTKTEPEIYATLPDIKQAAQQGRPISLFNLSQLVNQ